MQSVLILYNFRVDSIWVHVRISCGIHIGACTDFVRITCEKVTVNSCGKLLRNLVLFP